MFIKTEENTASIVVSFKDENVTENLITNVESALKHISSGKSICLYSFYPGSSLLCIAVECTIEETSLTAFRNVLTNVVNNYQPQLYALEAIFNEKTSATSGVEHMYSYNKDADSAIQKVVSDYHKENIRLSSELFL